AFSQEIDTDRYLNRRYSKMLAAIPARSFWNVSQSRAFAQGFRLLYFQAFYRTLIVEVKQSNGSATIRAIQLEQQRGIQSPKVVYDHTEKLTADQWTWILVHAEKCGFWSMPSVIIPKGDILGVADADELLIEGVDRQKYHLVLRNDPNREQGEFQGL